MNTWPVFQLQLFADSFIYTKNGCCSLIQIVQKAL